MGNAQEDNDGNLYALLGLKPGASDGEIRDAYYQLAKEYHPDRRKADAKAEETFGVVTRAAAILRDPEMRRRYDRGEISGSAFVAKPKGAERRSDRRRILLVFLVSLTVSTAAATKLWLLFLNRASEVPNLVRNDAGATSLKVVDASLPREKSSRGYGPQAVPLPPIDSPSLARSDSSSPHPQQPSSANATDAKDNMLPAMQGASSSSPSERLVDTEDRAAPPIPGAKALPAEPSSQKTASFGLPAFDTSPGGGRLLPAKLSLLREGKSKPEDCSLSRAARDIVLHVSAALRSR
jgi:hypothetical protein